jgi:hypothetical protein
MGYRSDVGVVIYPNRESTTDMSEDVLKLSDSRRTEQYEALKLLMGTAFKHVDNAFGGCMEWRDNCRMLQFHIEDVKWYPDYEDVRMFMQFLDSVNDLGYEYEYIRVGEGHDDVETQRSSGADYNLSLHRSICFD